MRIVGITSCPAGVAHTYMVAEALEEKCKSLNYECKIETQGANGAQNVLSPEDIAKADYVILALGKGLPDNQLSRFDNKKVIFVKISEALKNIDTIFENLEQNAILQEPSNVESTESDKSKNSAKTSDLLGSVSYKGDNILSHLMSGVSASLPFIIGGGLLIAIAAILEQFGIEKIPFDVNSGQSASISWILDQIGNLGFTLMIPVMSAFIASSIGSKPAFAPAAVCSYIANNKEMLGTDTGAGFIGAVILGIAIGYFVKYFIKINLGKYLRPLMGFFFVPLFTFLIFGLLTYYVLGPFASFLMNSLLNMLNSIPKEYILIGGFITGAMVASDMGGPINKAAWFFQIGMVSAGVYTWYAVNGVVQMLAPMSAAISCWIAPKLFTKQERENALSTFIVGATVATEPAIPYALAAPLPMFSANIISGGVTGAIVMMLGVERMAPSITILDPVFHLASPWYFWYLSLIIGLALNTLLIICFKGLWLKNKNKKDKSK